MLRNFTDAGFYTMTKFVIMLIWSTVVGLPKKFHIALLCFQEP